MNFKKELFVGICVSLFLIACSKEDDKKSQLNRVSRGNGVNKGQSVDLRYSIDEKIYSNLLAQGADAVLRKALINDLGWCGLKKVSDDGCGATQKDPLYQITILDGKKFFPISESLEPAKFCLDKTADSLKLALQLGLCYQNHIPFADMPNEGLAIKAALNDLNNCALTQADLQGCGGQSSFGPLFTIHLKDKKINFPNMSADPSVKYCFSKAGDELRRALNEGYCGL